MLSSDIKQKELKYIDDINAALLLASAKKPRYVLYLVVLTIILGVTWAGFAEIDEVTVGVGKVIPSQQVQVIQNLEGGILKEILVQEGQRVTAGETLLSIDSTKFLSEYREQATQRDSLLARIGRLKLEIENVNVMSVDELKTLLAKSNSLSIKLTSLRIPKEIRAQQHSVYKEKLAGLLDRTRVIDQQVNQKKPALKS
ncbi:biotin/lipoyl-binding protein [Psychrosphaera haliotis]|uniref:biotin/lipoyl-binding protein n=1 Tax=Psychrosphaera haliotis TaxID=555083 RepID=UPI0018C59DDC|nr:biotin/lipoyl-binding protein [Psychrosphaera haliotis]